MGDDLDVLVVGGGPAGAVASTWCAEAGLRVALIERRGGPTDRPGETLHPGIEPLLARLGVAKRVAAAGFPRHPGNWVSWGSEPRFVPFGSDSRGPWLGFQAHRATLDALLLERALEAGVRVHRPVGPARPVIEGGRVAGVALAGTTLPARVVVDAGGGRHWLARHLRIPVERRSPPLLARYGYATGACPELDGAPVIVADDVGWTWMARVGEGRYHWTRLVLHLPASPRSPATAPVPHARRPPLLAGLDGGPVRSADVTWRVVWEAAAPGWFMVGDAAGVLDPAASHGVLRAVMSGMQAAHLIRATLGGKVDEEAAARSYREWMLAWYLHDEAALLDFYGQLPAPPAWVDAGARRKEGRR